MMAADVGRGDGDSEVPDNGDQQNAPGDSGGLSESEFPLSEYEVIDDYSRNDEPPRSGDGPEIPSRRLSPGRGEVDRARSADPQAESRLESIRMSFGNRIGQIRVDDRDRFTFTQENVKHLPDWVTPNRRVEIPFKDVHQFLGCVHRLGCDGLIAQIRGALPEYRYTFVSEDKRPELSFIVPIGLDTDKAIKEAAFEVVRDSATLDGRSVSLITPEGGIMRALPYADSPGYSDLLYIPGRIGRTRVAEFHKALALFAPEANSNPFENVAFGVPDGNFQVICCGEETPVATPEHVALTVRNCIGYSDLTELSVTTEKQVPMQVYYGRRQLLDFSRDFSRAMGRTTSLDCESTIESPGIVLLSPGVFRTTMIKEHATIKANFYPNAAQPFYQWRASYGLKVTDLPGVGIEEIDEDTERF